MLTVSQKLVGLFILYEMLIHANGKITSLYQIALNLFSNPVNVALKEFLHTLLKSVSKISKMTPKQYMEVLSTSKTEEQSNIDFYKEPFKANTFTTPLISLVSILNTLDDYKDTSSCLPNLLLDSDELLQQELVPDICRALPNQDEFYLLQYVFHIHGI